MQNPIPVAVPTVASIPMDRVIRAGAWYMAPYHSGPIPNVDAFPVYVRDVDMARGGRINQVWLHINYIPAYVEQYNAQDLGSDTMVYDADEQCLYFINRDGSHEIAGYEDRVTLPGIGVFSAICLDWVHQEPAS